jgi:hypothetical protein
VIANRIDIHTPAVDRVAILAGSAELAAMDISVAISALLTDVSKNFLYVARITRDILVHAAQWILGFAIVVELDSLPDGRPACSGMAVLASDGKRTVRIARTRWFAGLGFQQAVESEEPAYQSEAHVSRQRLSHS